VSRSLDGRMYQRRTLAAHGRCGCTLAVLPAVPVPERPPRGTVLLCPGVLRVCRLTRGRDRAVRWQTQTLQPEAASVYLAVFRRPPDRPSCRSAEEDASRAGQRSRHAGGEERGELVLEGRKSGRAGAVYTRRSLEAVGSVLRRDGLLSAWIVRIIIIIILRSA